MQLGSMVAGKRFRRFRYLVFAFLLLMMAIVVIAAFDLHSSNDTIVAVQTSPDGRLIAELHSVTSSSHHNPDLINVMVRQSDEPFAAMVYSRTYECAPQFGRYQLRWSSSNELLVQTSRCFSGRWSTDEAENHLWQQNESWRGIAIHYVHEDYEVRTSR